MSVLEVQGDAYAPAGRPGAEPPRTHRPRLTVVPPPRRRPRRAPFVVLVLGLLGGGMVGLLQLNTALAEGAFTVQHLEERTSQLSDRAQELSQQVAVDDSPADLQRRATALGMVSTTSPVFLRLSDGAVLGTPTAATAPPAPVATTAAGAAARSATTGTTSASTSGAASGAAWAVQSAATAAPAAGDR